MLATPLHPRQVTALFVLALAFTLVLALAIAPDLESLSLSIGSEPASTSEPATTTPESGTPIWVSDPLRPPLETLARP